MYFSTKTTNKDHVIAIILGTLTVRAEDVKEVSEMLVNALSGEAMDMCCGNHFGVQTTAMGTDYVDHPDFDGYQFIDGLYTTVRRFKQTTHTAPVMIEAFQPIDQLGTFYVTCASPVPQQEAALVLLEWKDLERFM